MSTVALDRQHRWRCRLQDFSPHLQPPTPLSQPLKPSPSSLHPSHLHPPSSSSCCPVSVSPLQNPAAFKICLFPSAVPPVFGVSRSLVPHSSAVTQTFYQGNDTSRFSPSPPSSPRCLPFNSSQTCNYHSFPTSSNIRTSSHAPDTLNPIVSSQVNQVSSQDTQSCCNFKVTQADSSSTSSCMTACNMHAQTASGALAVSAIDSATLTHRKCPSEGLFLGVNQMCLWNDLEPSSCNGAVPAATKFPEIDSPAFTSTTSSSSYSTSPLLKTANSSSVPKSLESYTCFKGIATTALSLAANRQSNNNYVSFYTSSCKFGLKNSCSKSDSNLCHIKSINTDSTELPKEGKTLKTKCFKPRESVLSTKERGESLTTEEDSSSFDSGQEDTLDSLNRDPNHKSRKKRLGSHNQQDENHTSQEKSSNVIEHNEENLTSQEEIGVPYSKSNSRGSIGGKTKAPVCCPRRRLIDDEGYIRRAACLCVNKEETQVLLVSSKKDRCAWLVPGGGLEVGEDPVSAATREAWEEAGVLGHINRYLGLFESYHHSGLKKHRTAVYVLTVTEEHNHFPEARLGRRRQWFSTEEALLHLTHHRPLQSAYIQLMLMSRLKEPGTS